MPAAPPSTQELGHVASWSQFAAASAWAGVPQDPTEETDAWIWPASIRTIDRMWHSSQVGSVWWALTLPLLGDIWSLDPQDADPARVALLAEDIDLPMLGEGGERIRKRPVRRRGRFSWSEFTDLSLLHLKYGHMGFEQVYDADVLAATGQARIRKLAPRMPHTIADIYVEPDGGLRSIRQWPTQGNARPDPIPVDRLVWFVHGKQGANWQGTSILRAAYGDWLLLDRLIRVRAQTIERNGMGIPIGIAPEGVTDQGRIDEYGEIAQRARAGEYSGIGLPHGADVRFRGVEGTLPNADAAITDHRAMIAESVQAQFMKLGQTASGNRALGESFLDFFALALDAVAGGMADVATQHIVEDWWDLNYGPDDPAPAIVARPVDAERDIPATAITELIKAKAITADDAIEGYLRGRFHLPARTSPRPAPTPPPVPVPPVVVAPVGPPTLAQDVAAARRVAAVSSATWRSRINAAIAGLVDPDAIAAAVAYGTAPAAAVEAGISADVGPLAAVLADLWGDAYGRGSTSAAGQVSARRMERHVVAGLTDLLARARDAAAGIVATIRDRLVTLVAGRAADATDADLRAAIAAALDDESQADAIEATESHRGEVMGALDTWSSAGVTEQRWVQTSSEADDCADRNGTVADWSDDPPPLHPRCRCELEPA